jgi:hypothetical protein
VTALFLLSASVIFTESVPSFAANRFLSTLGLVPLLHVLYAASRRAPLRRFEAAAVAFQGLLLASAIAFRGSANWLVCAFASFLVVLITVRRDPDWKTMLGAVNQFMRNVIRMRVARSTFVRAYNRVAVNPILSTGFLVLIVITGASLIRTAQVSERYFRDDNLPHHLIWHSAYLGLALHPEWPKYKPFPDVPESRSDGVGFIVFEHRMRERGEPAASQSGEIYSSYYYRARVYEKLIRSEYFSFLKAHPTYALQLFFYYKPMRLKEVLFELIGSIPLQAVLLGAVSVLLGCLPILLSPGTALSCGAQLGRMVGLVWLWSLLPVFWAYPESYVMSDTAWATLLVLLMLPCVIVALAAGAVTRISNMRRDIQTPSPVET